VPKVAIDTDFLDNFQPEGDWAEAHGLTSRTTRRYRAAGLPFLKFGGLIYIDKRAARTWIEGRVRIPAKPRIRQRRAP
jgi:hypothetical protein